MLEELERQELQEDLVVPRLEVAPPAPVLLENDQRQRRRMVIALVMLLVALGMVLIKDRDFWFPASDIADSEVLDDAVATQSNETVAADSRPAAPSAPIVRRRARPVPPPAKKETSPVASSAPGVSTTRAVLPPLSVVVVAGGQSQVVKPPAPPSVKVELQKGTAPQAVSDASRVAAELAAAAKAPANTPVDRVEMSTDTRQALTRPVRPEYPLLARQMKVQGAVVLNVFIDKDGAIQNVSVLSGPAILADAAREAVKQWRFKPYYQDGQAVETQARVTVDFTIRTQ